jgi:hypothetical protein
MELLSKIRLKHDATKAKQENKRFYSVSFI